MAVITEDMTVMEVLKLDKESASVFMTFGLHCLGCPGATGESLKDASRVHGISADDLVSELNKFFESKK